MKERIKEIMEYLIDPDSNELRDPSVLRVELERMGYSRAEITRAFSMLRDEEGYADTNLNSTGRVNNRVFCEVEKAILSVAAQGYLIKLYRLGWLSEAQLAVILEGALMEYTTPVSLEDIKSLAVKYTPDLPESTDDENSSQRSTTH